MVNVIELVLSLLGSALNAAKVSDVASEVVAGIEAAIKELEKVRGTDVTFEQIEGLRVQAKW